MEYIIKRTTTLGTGYVRKVEYKAWDGNTAAFFYTFGPLNIAHRFQREVDAENALSQIKVELNQSSANYEIINP
jgi:hypothetical protein